MDKNEKRGYIQVYTGNGKGKTTAAIGLAIRAAGAGLKVYIAQFIKMGDYSEIKALKRFSDLITVEFWKRPMWPPSMDSSGNRTFLDLLSINLMMSSW